MDHRTTCWATPACTWAVQFRPRPVAGVRDAAPGLPGPDEERRRGAVRLYSSSWPPGAPSTCLHPLEPLPISSRSTGTPPPAASSRPPGPADRPARGETHWLALRVEQANRLLSTRHHCQLHLDGLEAGLIHDITAEAFSARHCVVDRVAVTVAELLDQAGVARIRWIRCTSPAGDERCAAAAGTHRSRPPAARSVEGDLFGSIGAGSRGGGSPALRLRGGGSLPGPPARSILKSAKRRGRLVAWVSVTAAVSASVGAALAPGSARKRWAM